MMARLFLTDLNEFDRKLTGYAFVIFIKMAIFALTGKPFVCKGLSRLLLRIKWIFCRIL